MRIDSVFGSLQTALATVLFGQLMLAIVRGSWPQPVEIVQRTTRERSSLQIERVHGTQSLVQIVL